MKSRNPHTIFGSDTFHPNPVELQHVAFVGGRFTVQGMPMRIITPFFFFLIVLPSLHAQVRIPENMVVDGVPPIPAPLVEAAGRYNEFRSASFSCWHPVKREMLIGTRFGDVGQIHQVLMPGGARTQLTFFKDAPAAIGYEPKKGSYFLYSMDRNGNENRQIYRYDVESGSSTLLTDGKSQNGGVVFSNRGDRIAYESTRRNGKDRDLYIMDPRTPSTDRLVMQGEGGGWAVLDWSPDDATLLVSNYISANESEFFLVNATSGARELLTPKGTEPVAWGGGRFAADGKSIFVTTDRDAEFSRLCRMDLATKALTVLSEDISWDVSDFDLNPARTLVAFTTNENGLSVLRVRDVRTLRDLSLPRLPIGILGGVSWHPNGTEIGFTMMTPRSPADVYSIVLTKKNLVRWTKSETGGIRTEDFAEPKLISWKSFDGKVITGFLYQPPARFTGKRPVIVEVHGGPEGQSRPSFLGQRNYLLNELGVVLVYPNVRGSTGYGKTFLASDNGFRREDSYKDVVALLDWIKAQPNLDGDRIMVTGGSYGGNVTLAISAFYSDKIACALSEVGASNLVTFLENTADYRRDLRRVEYGDERDPKMREFLNRIAPLNHAEKIRKPLFIVQGANDPRVPASEAEQMVAKLKSINTPVWYMLAKDEGHGFAKKPNRDLRFYATLLFVKKYLMGEG